MTVQTATSAQMTCEEIHNGFDALIGRVADLAAERDVARQIGSQTTKDLVRTRHQVHVGDVVNAALRTQLDEVRAELRRTLATCRNLAVEKGALEAQINRMQNPPDPRPHDHTRRWPFKRAGNQL